MSVQIFKCDISRHVLIIKAYCNKKDDKASKEKSAISFELNVVGIVQRSNNTWVGMDPEELVYDAASNTWAGMDPEELVYVAASNTWAGMDPEELVYVAASNTWAGMDPEELVYWCC